MSHYHGNHQDVYQDNVKKEFWANSRPLGRQETGDFCLELQLSILGMFLCSCLGTGKTSNFTSSPLWSKETEPENTDSCESFTLSSELKDINGCWSLPLKHWEKKGFHLLLDSSLTKRPVRFQKSHFLRWENTKQMWLRSLLHFPLNPSGLLCEEPNRCSCEALKTATTSEARAISSQFFHHLYR